MFSSIRKDFLGSSLVAYWLGFQPFTAMAWVQSLVGELRSRKLRATRLNCQSIIPPISHHHILEFLT